MISQSEFSTLREQLKSVLPELSNLESQVAQFMLLNISDLSFETGASLASKVGTSEITVSRLLRRLGYAGMRGLKRELRSQLVNHKLLLDVANINLDVPKPVTEILDLEIEAIRDVFQQSASPTWAKLIKEISEVDRVYVTGFQTVRGLAEDCARRLALARGDVQFLSAHDGMLAEWLRPPIKKERNIKECLILIDVVAYAREAPIIAELCEKTGRSLVIVTDEMCHWAKNHTDLVVYTSTRCGLFLESTVAITAALNLIIDAVAKEHSSELTERLQVWKATARSLNIF
jgi:DNA-binding MurR/RpiR family transcriptional regulator